MERPHSVLVFLHGLKSHSGWFLEVGSALAEKGIKVYAFDRRGSGKSVYERGHIDDYRHWLEDIRSVVKLAREENPHLKPHILGHCFGAKLALAFAINHPSEIQSLTLIAPPQFSLKVDITFLEKCKVMASLLFRKKSYIKVPIRDEMFTRNPEKHQFIKEDKLKLERLTTKFCFEVFKIDRWICKNLKRLKQPILVLLASEDEVVDNSKIQKKFFARLSCHRKDLEIFDCMHDLFFEPEHEKVINRIAEWIIL